MISNPGQAQSSTTMLTTTYDTTNKKQDIFAYTDSKVADKITSSQVASQISSATANFVTSSQVDAKIKTSEDDRFKWHSVVVYPFSSDTDSFITLDANFILNNPNSVTVIKEYYYAVKLPIPIYIKTYAYQVTLDYLGLVGKTASGTVEKPYLWFFDIEPSNSSVITQDFRWLGISKKSNTTDNLVSSYESKIHLDALINSSGFMVVQGYGSNWYPYGYSESITGVSNTLGTSSRWDKKLSVTYVGFDLGETRTTISTGATTDSRKTVQSFGMILSYRALS